MAFFFFFNLVLEMYSGVASPSASGKSPQTSELEITKSI